MKRRDLSPVRGELIDDCESNTQSELASTWSGRIFSSQSSALSSTAHHVPPRGAAPCLLSRKSGHSHDALMTVRVYNKFILHWIFRRVGPIYEHDCAKRNGRRALPGRQIAIGLVYFSWGNRPSVLRGTVFACLSADDKSAYRSNCCLRGSAALAASGMGQNLTR